MFIVLLHGTALGLTFLIFRDNKLLFLASEVIILVAAGLSIALYKELIRPLARLTEGIEAIHDRDFTVKFRPTGKYEMDQLIQVYNDMIDALRSERTKQEEQHFFLEKLIESSPTGIILLDYDQRVSLVNPKALQLLGIPGKELTGKPIHTIDIPLVRAINGLASGESASFSVNGIESYKLQKSHFIDRGFTRSFVMIEELSAEMLAAEKKAYGKVIRMMSHEVNNTIGPVNSILQSVLQSQVLLKEEKGTTLQHALQVAADRNHNLNLFMRNFADVVRLPDPVLKDIDLHVLLQRTGQLMEMKAGEKQIRFEYRLGDAAFTIRADLQQMEQVLINIIKNALEAIEEQGAISFTTRTGPRQLIIADNGKGIPDEVAGQLFSPFFSTKKDGQGLGLTIIRDILVKHGYVFSLKTMPGGDTEFRIDFE